MTDPRDVVRRGYDTLGPRYDEWAAGIDPTEKLEHLAELIEALPDGSKVLELGCGPGRPVAQQLAARFDYTGVDFSAAQLALARVNAPRARFVRADMTDVEFAPYSFDAVVAFFSIIHVPRDEQPALFERIASWIRPDGLFVANFGTNDEVDGSDTWVDDVPMFWSSFDPDTTKAMIEGAGFTIQDAHVVEDIEDGQVVRFLWVTAWRTSVL